MKKHYTFIHPTKAGGTAVEQYFDKHYSEYIKGWGHNNICTNENNPIIIVRDVKSRFNSMFKYWKNGASDGIYKRDKEWIAKHSNVSIFDFINLLKTNKKELYSGFTWDMHFNCTTRWINPDINYKNIIIIKYESNLNNKIQKLINELGIENKNIELPIKNVSNNNNCEYDLNNEIINEFINEHFSSDVELINKIDSSPELFKMVI